MVSAVLFFFFMEVVIVETEFHVARRELSDRKLTSFLLMEKVKLFSLVVFSQI